MSYIKGSGRFCAVFGCTNSQKKLYLWKKAVCFQHNIAHEDCPCLIPFSLHRFPRNQVLRKMWIAAISRKSYKPSMSSAVCSVHFVERKPTKENNCPQIELGYKKKVTFGRKNRKPLVPSTKVENNLIEGIIERKESGDTTKNMDFLFVQEEPVQNKTLNSIDYNYTSLGDHNYAHNVSFKSTSIQTEKAYLVITSDTEFKFYTTLPKPVFSALVNILAPNHPRTIGLHIEQCVLLVLMRLRLGLLFQDLAFRFKISKSTANRIFIFWIKHLAVVLQECIVWLPRETIYYTMPECFKKHYPRTTCIIDCTEIFVQRPFNLKARATTYSDYKSHNTVKYLIAIAPNGLIMFTSKGYGGRASDRFITLDSKLLNYLLPCDQVMADRGFTIYEDLLSKHVGLNIPAFTKGQKQLPAIEVVTSRRIASVRIHVERVIGRLKNFNLLRCTNFLSSMSIIDDIVLVCCALCNLNKKIV